MQKISMEQFKKDLEEGVITNLPGYRVTDCRRERDNKLVLEYVLSRLSLGSSRRFGTKRSMINSILAAESQKKMFTADATLTSVTGPSSQVLVNNQDVVISLDTDQTFKPITVSFVIKNQETLKLFKEFLDDIENESVYHRHVFATPLKNSISEM